MTAPTPHALPNRRRTLAWLGAAVAVAPIRAHAQDAPAPSTITTPAAPPVATPPATLPAPPHPAGPPPVAVPTAPPNAAIDRTKKYYVFFDQNIDQASMRALRRQLTTLVEAGVQDMVLVIHSAGGLVDPMLATYSFIRALPARIDTHAQGFVQSAATTLFLCGEKRTADHNARFLFHPSQVPFNGTMNSLQMQDRLNQFDAVDGVSRQIFHDRTTLSVAEIARFNREEVIYTAQQAQAGGVVQSVEDLHLPGPDKARILFLD